MSAKYKIIVFTRYPIEGNTKTRLIPELGSRKSADLHAGMTVHTLKRVHQFLRNNPVSVEIHYDGADDNMMQEWLGSNYSYRPQSEGDLGIRMCNAVLNAFEEGFKQVIIIGTDCPDLNPDHLKQAFDSLKKHRLVFGPAKDGGYYLVGVNNKINHETLPCLFTGIDWGSDRVLETSVSIASKHNISCTLLEPLADVDYPSDLYLLKSVNDPISVIIPALNEEKYMEKVIDSAQKGSNIEIIVVDASSTDRTREIARDKGATVIETGPGRAYQLNQAAQAATGDILLFLHADTILPGNYDDYVRWIIRTPGVVCGAFRLRIAADSQGLRIIEKLVNWRSKYLGMPYGDQALFVRKNIFDELGGFPEIPLMDDYVFVRSLKKQGRIRIVPEHVITSARRWISKGVFKTTLINQLIILAYHTGISPERLNRLYKRNSCQNNSTALDNNRYIRNNSKCSDGSYQPYRHK